MNKNDVIDPGILQSARDWVLRLSSENITAAELTTLQQWLAKDSRHRRAFERERGFWQDLEPHRALFESPALPDMRPHRALGRWRAPRSRHIWVSASAIAAAFALFLAAPDAMLRYRADHITAAGQVQTITLPDRSIAMLDSGSAIAVQYSDTQRRIELLQGRAWFGVKHGDARPFRVAALGGVAQDIGTAYEVARTDDAVEVAVSEGMVGVTGIQGRQLILQTGERARYAGALAETLPAVAPDRVAAWRAGELLIDDMPLAQAVRQIARYRRGATFLWSGKGADSRVSGVFRTDRPDDALAALANHAGLGITHLPVGTIILH